MEKRDIKEERIGVVNNWEERKEIVNVEKVENKLRREWGMGRKLVIGY